MCFTAICIAFWNFSFASLYCSLLLYSYVFRTLCLFSPSFLTGNDPCLHHSLLFFLRLSSYHHSWRLLEHYRSDLLWHQVSTCLVPFLLLHHGNYGHLLLVCFLLSSGSLRLFVSSSRFSKKLYLICSSFTSVLSRVLSGLKFRTNLTRLSLTMKPVPNCCILSFSLKITGDLLYLLHFI